MIKAKMIDRLMELAGTNEDFLWNEAIDIADVMDIIRERYEKCNKKILLYYYEKSLGYKTDEERKPKGIIEQEGLNEN